MASPDLHGLLYNTGPIEDPDGYVRDRGCAGWLFLCGDEFAEMGGLSWDRVQQAADHTARIPSDPPRDLDLDLARRHVAALDALPRPTLVSCRAGPRASAVVYLYAGLRSDVAAEDVLAAADAAGAPFTAVPAYRDWVVRSLAALRED